MPNILHKGKLKLISKNTSYPTPLFLIFSLVLRLIFFKRRKVKINTSTTYRNIASIFIAILLLNAPVFKEIHTFFLHGHHHEQEVEHNDICNHSTHMHEIEHVALDCSICDFHFSPSEKIVYTFSNLIIFPTSEKVYFYTENIPYRNGDPYPTLRGPPINI